MLQHIRLRRLHLQAAQQEGFGLLVALDVFVGAPQIIERHHNQRQPRNRLRQQPIERALPARQGIVNLP